MVFFASASILPSFAAVGTALSPVFDGDGMMISTEAYDIDELSNNFNSLSVGDDGVLSNLSMGYDDGRISSDHIVEYTVREGDTVGGIAVRYGISSSTILKANGLSSTKIKPGRILKILPVDGVLYTVREGISVEEVAKKYQIDPIIIADQNGIDMNTMLTQGMEIVIPGGTASPILIADNAKDPSTQETTLSEKPQSELKGPAKTTIKDDKKKEVIKKTEKKNVPREVEETAQGSSLRWPTASPVITQKYHAGHPAIDICYTKGDHTTAIVAAAGGTVIKAQGGYNGGYGNMVIIDHGNGLRTLYAHMRELYVVVGQQVTAGQAVGWMGNTGRSYGRTGLHLHFEVIKGTTKLNPLNML